MLGSGSPVSLSHHLPPENLSGGAEDLLSACRAGILTTSYGPTLLRCQWATSYCGAAPPSPYISNVGQKDRRELSVSGTGCPAEALQETSSTASKARNMNSILPPNVQIGSDVLK